MPWAVQFRFPTDGGNFFFFFLATASRLALSGPPVLLSNGYRGVKPTIHLHYSGLRMHGVTAPFTNTFLWRGA
jgi:hypothetical protein